MWYRPHPALPPPPDAAPARPWQRRQSSLSSPPPPFSHLLRVWSSRLAGGQQPRWRVVLYAACSSKWSMSLCALFMARLAVDLALAESSEARRMPLRYFCGIYSCTPAVLFFARHSPEASSILALLSDVSEQLERRGRPGTQELLAARARAVTRVSAFYTCMMLTQVAGVTHLIFTYKDSAVAAALGAAPNLYLNVLHVAAVLTGVVTYYRMLPLMFASFGSCSGLYRALGRESEDARWCGAHGLRWLAAQHARLAEGARRSRLMFADLLPHILSVDLILPLIGTVEIIVGADDVDSFTMSTFGIIVTSFIPFCLMGQELEDASTSLPSRLYWAAWLEETPAARTLRVQLMLGSGKRAHVAVGGLGALNASSCVRVVNRWFSCLNVFISMRVR